MDSYDIIPYQNNCYFETSPESINAIAKLLNFDAVDIKKANVLEIGSAMGCNIIPLAARYPEAKFTGVDMSQKQVDTAKKIIDRMGLKNITMIAEDISNYDFMEQKYDYIIIHGVYSWVSEAVQDSIFKAINNVLSERGIAYISYNVLPGWGKAKTVRDMVRYHIKNFEDPLEKLQQGRAFLEFIVNNKFIDEKSGHYNIIKGELDIIKEIGNWYLYHDYLETSDNGIYFHEFMRKAGQHNLTYLSDVSLSTMTLSNKPKILHESFKDLNGVEIEQYLDFIYERRFRRSLLVKNGAKFNKSITSDRLSGLNLLFKGALADNTITHDQVHSLECIKLKLAKDSNEYINIESIPAVYSACIELSRSVRKYPSIEQLIDKVITIFPDESSDKIKSEVLNLCTYLLSYGFLTFTRHKNSTSESVSDKPVAFLPSVHYSQLGDMVPSIDHYSIRLTTHQRIMIQYLNGQNTVEGISKLFTKDLIQNKMNLTVEGKDLDLKSSDTATKILDMVKAELRNFNTMKLLVA